MTNNKFFNKIRKLFSMKNDTVEEAKSRLTRAIVCIPFSLLPPIMLMSDFCKEARGVIEIIIVTIFFLCSLTSFISTSSLLGPIKAAIAYVKWLMSRPIFIMLPLIGIVLSIILFVYTLASTFAAPIFITVYGVFKAKKNLEEVRESALVGD